MKTLFTLFKNNIREYGMLIALIAIMVFFQYQTKGVLLKPINITNLFLQNSYVIIMALGMLLVIIAGWIDLSIGSVAAFVGAIAAVMMIKMELPWWLAILVSLFVGALIGAWNGYWVAYVKIPAFIATLAGMLIFRGLTYLILNGEQIGRFPDQFQKLSTGFIPDFFNFQGLHLTTILIGVILSIVLIYLDVQSRINQKKYGFEITPTTFFVLKNALITFALMGLCYLLASYKGLPNVLVLMAVFIAFYTFVTNQTVLGRRIYAMGGNEKATRLSGVDTPKLLFQTFFNHGSGLSDHWIASVIMCETKN
jgi:putative multiple sugar transport system permease protein